MPDAVNEDPDQMIRDVGQRIEELRQRSGISISEFAQKLGVTYQNLRRVERGEQNLTIRTMVKLASALGVRTVDLFAPPGSGLPKKRKPPEP